MRRCEPAAAMDFELARCGRVVEMQDGAILSDNAAAIR
jgi:hypothetical protein